MNTHFTINVTLASHHSGSSSNAALLAAQYPLECVPELWTEYRVDDGVERRIEVSQPQAQTHQNGRYLA